MTTLLLSTTKKMLALFALIFFFTGCFKDKLTKTYTIFEPVYRIKAEVLAGIRSDAPQTVKAPGKIYMYGRYVFLNEVNKGVHIIDNINPANPVMVGFINIPGNLDIAVKQNTLYADLYTDLLAIDISDPLQAKLTKRVPNIFPERQYGNGFVPDTSLIIVDWIKKDTTVEINNNNNPRQTICANCFALLSADNSGAKSGAYVPGIAGSMARFAIVHDYLYAVNRHTLNVISVNIPAQPVFIKTSGFGWNIETIYPFKDKLFLGSSNGMFIYDISTPSSPVQQGRFNHARACDPVVADDNYAFVTLRAGTFCEGTNNQLDVINVENVMSPSLVKTYAMTNPHGLAKDGHLLFLCDGIDGLKILDASSVTNIKLLKHLKGLETYDVIAWNKRLLVVATSGLYQYDYTDIDNIKLLSSIQLNR